MPLSNRFKELEKRLSELRKNFLPKRFSPTGSYTNEQLDLARGYRLLVHAEIESYLEDRAKQVVLDSYKLWERDKRPRQIIVYLLAFLKKSSENVHDGIDSEQKKKNMDDIKGRINKVVTEYNRLLDNNHGIRENNILKILLPIGINMTDINTTWLNNIDSFGSARGDIAHKSHKTTKIIDPKNEYHTVKEIMLGCKDIDKQLNKLQ